MYAQVVVNDHLSRLSSPESRQQDASEPLGTSYHYEVPAHLGGVLQPGHLVWVGFGERRIQGIVVDLTDQSPISDTRPLESLVMDEPVLTSTQLDTARWMSVYCLAPLLDCLRLMLPPGLLRRAEPVLAAQVSPPFSEDLTDTQRQLMLQLQDGPQAVRRLRRRVPALLIESAVADLVSRGYVNRRQEVVRPPLQPKTDRRVRLIVGIDELAGAVPKLGHSSKQADVLSWLHQSDDPLPTLQAVREGAGCTSAPVKALAEKGWLEVTERRTILVPLVEAEDQIKASRKQLSRASRQAEALDALLEQGVPVDQAVFREQHQVSLGTLRALEERGLLRRVKEQPCVVLLLGRDEVPDLVLELRGAGRHKAVIDALLDLADEVTEGESVSEWIGWFYAETGCTLATLRDLEAMGLIVIEDEEVSRDPLLGRHFVTDRPPHLTAEQQSVWRALAPALDDLERSRAAPHSDVSAPAYLLHGVTGSGKTEIYLRAIARALSAGRQAIVLVPEISLTPQTIRRFAARFPGRIGTIHSQMSRGERYDTWRRIRAGKIDIVIGPRSALLQPLPRLGLIAVDEEHDDSYKQDDTISRSLVRYDARRIARYLAAQQGIMVIFGSATPSLEAYGLALDGQLALLELSQRILSGAPASHYRPALPGIEVAKRKATRPVPAVRYVDLPEVEIVDLRHELRVGNRSIFSRSLRKALASTLSSGQQAILFLNRRGAATFVMCRDCGYVPQCPRCDVSLTYHAFDDMSSRGDDVLVCHHCNRQEAVPKTCPQCGGSRIRHFGIGTQKVVDEVRRLHPKARLLRWDWDATRSKGAHEAILAQFSSHEADVLIGTQMIAKGLDFPQVTLVGVITADTALHLPDFRSAERTFQLLAQVAGRAGRGALGGKVIMQSYSPEHYAIQAASQHDYRGFYQAESSGRRRLAYPPFIDMVQIVAVDESEEASRAAAEDVAEMLQELIRSEGISAALIGPVPCFFARQRGRSRWQVVVRSDRARELVRRCNLPANCYVDVDPVSLL